MKKRTFCPGWSLAAPFVPVGVTNRDKRSSFVPVARPGTKGHPLLSRTGVSGWETGTTAVSQPGQINVFVVVPPDEARLTQPAALVRDSDPSLTNKTLF